MDYFQREYPSIPLIVLTGLPDLDLAKKLMKQGMTDYFVKPVDREKLTAAVENALAQRRISWFFDDLAGRGWDGLVVA